MGAQGLKHQKRWFPFRAVEGVQDLPTMSNGILAGLVGITAPAATVEPWAAVVIGLVAGPIYYFGACPPRGKYLVVWSLIHLAIQPSAQ
jgi:hypothetical protein